MHTKEHENPEKMQGQVESECRELERPLWHARLMWAGWAILEIYQREVSLILHALRITRKERTTIPNDRI